MMSIKKRTPFPERFISTYHEYRAKRWDEINRTDYDFHSSAYKIPGGFHPQEEDDVVLNPKPHLFYKDVWHCGSSAKAREVVREVAQFPDVKTIELKSRWVYVQWNHQGVGHLLPGQPTEERGLLKG
jgi:hypothetical protein